MIPKNIGLRSSSREIIGADWGFSSKLYTSGIFLGTVVDTPGKGVPPFGDHDRYMLGGTPYSDHDRYMYMLGGGGGYPYSDHDMYMLGVPHIVIKIGICSGVPHLVIMIGICSGVPLIVIMIGTCICSGGGGYPYSDQDRYMLGSTPYSDHDMYMLGVPHIVIMIGICSGYPI